MRTRRNRLKELAEVDIEEALAEDIDRGWERATAGFPVEFDLSTKEGCRAFDQEMADRRQPEDGQ